MCAGIYVNFAGILSIIVFPAVRVDGGRSDIILHVPHISPGRYWDVPQGNLEMYNNDRHKLQTIELKGIESRRDIKPLVEIGPGFFKSSIITYPDNYLVNQFKKLLTLKKKMMEKKKIL